MLTTLFDLARPALLALEPEDAHELTLKMLERGLYPRAGGADSPALSVEIWGLRFPNPLAIAAGFDKDARVPGAVLGMGCGFAEVGTTTPLAQPGNPRPRVFRLNEDQGVINRLGFNNEGHAAARRRLALRAPGGIIAVNIGANRESADRTGDYVKGLDAFNDVASLFTVNISSPNTPGLRDLQAPAALDELLGRLMARRSLLAAEGKPRRPIVVKLAPDIAEEDIGAICAKLLEHGVDGIAVSNTTLSRVGLRDRLAKEAGGLSGRPLFHRSTVMLARVFEATGGRIPLIGVGGIDSGEAALSKIEAGATLLQLYTGLIYQGPGLIGRIKAHLAAACRERKVSSLLSLSGLKAKEWAAKPLDRGQP
jgi:dihydroorotate dehydrogenase